MPGELAPKVPSLSEALARSENERLDLIHSFMSPRYQEGYTKGVHDLDAAHIFDALISTHVALQLGRYEPAARACAVVYWQRFCPPETRALFSAKLKGFAERNRLFPGDPAQQNYINALQRLVASWLEQTPLYPGNLAIAAGEYLFYELISGASEFVVSREADQLTAAFNQHLVQMGARFSAHAPGR
jgi:hypothetical protein